MRLFVCICLCFSAVLAAVADEPEYLNDRAIRQSIERQANALAEAEKTAENASLQQRLQADSSFAGNAPEVFSLTEGGADLYDRVDDGVLVIARMYLCGRCDRLHASCASGFAVTADGLVVTNHHVMASDDENTITFVAMTRSGKVYPIVEVLAASDKHDLALIRLDMGQDKLSPVPIARTAEVGESVHVVSHPSGRFYEYSRGHVGRFLISQRNQNTARISVTSHYGGGSSGGPIFNDQGQVVAVVSEAEVVRDRKIVFYDAVPYSAILDLFDNNKQARE